MTASAAADAAAAAEPTALRARAWRAAGARGWVDPTLIGALTSLVAAVGYWRPSIWTDEAATITSATRSLPELWHMIHNIDAVHGLYYLFMHFWIAVFGSSALSIRLPSLLAVGIAAAGTVVLARRLTNRSVALLAGVAFALLPRVTWAGTEARSTAFIIAAGAWTTVALIVALRRGRWWWVVYGTAVWLSTLLFLDFVLVVAAHGVTVAWTYRRQLRAVVPWVASAAVGVALTAPISLLVLQESSQINPGRPGLRRTGADVLIKQFFLGAPPTHRQEFPSAPLPLWAVSSLLVAVACWALVLWALVRRADRAVQRADAPVGLLPLLLPWLVLPPVVLVGYSALVTAVYNARYLAFCVPVVAILLGIALASLRPYWARVLTLGLIALLAVPVYASQRTVFAKKANDWVVAASIVGTRAHAGDVVVYGARSNRYLNSRRVEVAYPRQLADLRDITLDRTGAQLGTLWGSSRPLAQVMGELAGADRVWLVSDRLKDAVKARAKEIALLTAAGYHRQYSWRGPSTIVQEYVR